jgi:molecular chaperone DnaJ
VHVHVEVPRKLSARAEELLRELAEEEQAEVSPKRSSFFSRLADYFTADPDRDQESEESA